MIFSTTQEIPGYEIETNLGVVSGNVVQSKHLISDFMAGLRGIIGGEVKGYTEMYAESRETAMARMVVEAEKLKADAVINIRFSTSAIMTNASEILVYGTAVTLGKSIVYPEQSYKLPDSQQDEKMVSLVPETKNVNTNTF